MHYAKFVQNEWKTPLERRKVLTKTVTYDGESRRKDWNSNTHGH